MLGWVVLGEGLFDMVPEGHFEMVLGMRYQFVVVVVVVEYGLAVGLCDTLVFD